jgi:hypothetical protein
MTLISGRASSSRLCLDLSGHRTAGESIRAFFRTWREWHSGCSSFELAPGAGLQCASVRRRGDSVSYEEVVVVISYIEAGQMKTVRKLEVRS